MNNPNNSREKLYTRLKDDGYDLVDFDTFSKKLDEESSRKSLYDQMTSAGYDLGGYDEYTRKIVGSPFKQNNSVAPTPSEKPEEEKAMISAPSASTDEEYITGFGQGVKQGMQQLAAGVKYAGGEALDLVTKTAKDNASALAALDKMQAEGKDVAQETKRDAKSVLLPLIGHSAPAIDMVARVFGKKNPIAKANAEVANDKIIRKALEETDGDVEAARALLEQRANTQTTADEWRDEAAQVMNEAKPTKGAGAWVGNMIPQMVGTAAGLGLSAITKSPLPAQILGLGQMGALTASTAGASMKEARDAGATNGEVWATGLADAAIEFATEAIPFKGYLSPLVKQMKSKTGKAIADVIVDKKSPARKELQNLLDKANAQLGGKLFTTENAAKYLDDVLKEGASEFTAEALQTITPMLYAEPENYPTLWEVFSNGIEGLKGGIFMGSVLGGVANAATNKAQRDRRKEQGFVNVAEVKVSEDSDETTIAEVIDYDDQADRASILINGEIMPLENASKNIVNQEVFTFEEFDRGQVDMEHAESYDRGRNIATPQEKNDALNDLEAQEANIRQRYSLDPDADVYEFMGGDPIAYAMNETDTELRSEILDLVNAKAVYDGMTDGINERIATTIEESDRLIDSHVNKDDNLIHTATLKGVDENSDRKVYIISGAFARNEDGTIDTTDLAEGASMIVMDATTGKKEFIDPRNLKDIAEGINPAVAKQRAAETITNEIATKEEAEIAGTLAFVPNEIYTIADENGVEHTATIVADTQDGNVQVIIDNAQEPMLMPKEKVQQMADAYNIGRANAKIAEKKAQSTIAQSSSEVKPVIPMDEQGKPIYEQAPVEATWAELLSLNDGNAEEAIDTAKIMRDNAKKALDKANKAASAKGDTVEAIQQAKAERKALIDAAQAKYDYWDNVANYQASQPQEVVEPTTAEEQTPIVENASFDENINEVEQVYNEESNERSTENTDVSTSVPAEDGIADGDQTGVEMVQGAGTDSTLGDRGSIEAGQGSNEDNVGEGVADVPSADVSGAEEVDNVYNGQEADISDEDIEALLIKSRDELWKPNDEIADILNEKLYEAHPEAHQPEDRKMVVRHLIEAAEKYKDHPIAKEVLKYVKYPQTTSMRVSPLTNREEMRRKPLRARAKMWEAKVGVPVHLIETLEEVPTKDARKAILDGKVVTAWVTDGEVYLYMPYLRNRTEVDKTYIHEVVAHVGMKRLLGKEGYRQFCMRVYNEVMTEADRKFYDAYPNVKDHAQAADEYIAHLSEDTDMESSIWQKVVRIFRDALRVLGIETALTNKDIQDMLRDSYKNLTNEENVADIDEESGQAMFSIRTYDEGGRAKLVDFLNGRVKDNALTQAEADEVLTSIDDIRQVAEKYRNKYAPFGAWSDAKVVENKDGKPAFSVIRKNGEYTMNLDFSTVCKKRRTLDAVFSSMIDRGLMETLPMDGEQIAEINNIIRKHGFETACALCFVDAKRFRVAQVADKFCEMWNTMARMNDRQLKATVKAEKNKSVRQKVAMYLLENPEERVELKRENLIDSKGFEDITINKPEVLSFYKQAQGTSLAKIPYGDVQYMNDIENSNWTPDKAYAVGGVRLQSFSDYVPRMFFDYMQMMAGLVAKQMPVHAYTKEPIFAKQFGLTGMKINLSLVPKVVDGGVAAGLDADGNYAWMDGETFPYDEAIALQNAEGYRENCGTIAVGVSDEHILKMLDDPNIRMVIPYHKSGLNPLVAKKNRISEFADYTNVQNTRSADGGKLGAKALKDMPNFNALMHEGMDARQAAQAYLDWCDENGFLPKFDNFRNHPNYYKLLEDFTTIVPDANGVETIYPQGAVSMTFPTEEDAFGSIESLIREGLEEDAILEGRRDENVEKIVDTIEDALGEANAQFRILDTTKAELKDKPIKLNGMYRFKLKSAFKGVKGAEGAYPYLKVQLTEVSDSYDGKKVDFRNVSEGLGEIFIPKGLITKGEKDNEFFIDPKLIEDELWEVLNRAENYYEWGYGDMTRFRISDYDAQFADLQSEYDALDKNDEKALNEWREKKTSAVRDYLTHIKDRFGMRSELIVFNGADEEQMREAYTKIVASYKAKSNANPPTYEDFKKKSLRKDMVAMYRKNGDTITFNAVADDLNDKMQFAETMFHEDAHRVSYGLYTSDEFETIWKDAKKSKDRVAKVVDRLYGDKDDVTKGKEYIAKAVGYLANKQKDSFMQFMKGEMPVDELLKKLRSNSKIAKLAVEETLNVIKDEYRVQVSRRGDTRRMGGVGYGSDLQDTGVVLQGNGGTEQGGSADRDSRYRVRVLDSTLADMVGEESYNKFLDGVFRDADDSIRREMVNRAMQNGLDFRTATQEYLSNLVNENADSIFLSEVKDLYVGTLEDAGIDMGDISDNELRYALWKNNQKDNGVFSLAEDVVMRNKLGVGNYTQEADTSFRVADITYGNFYDYTKATFNEVEKPAREADYTSNSGSQYWYGEDKNGQYVVRGSNHWSGIGRDQEDLDRGRTFAERNGRNTLIGSCQWELISNKTSKELRDSYPNPIYGKVYLKDMKPRFDNNQTDAPSNEREQIIADAKADGTYLKAPNGKDTNLTPEQWVTVRTDAFKKWFGDWENDLANASKVVDANGEPKVVYNGSKVQHYNYDGRLRTKGQSATNSKVSFFTDNKDVAERYGKFVNEVFLNIRNPYEIDYNGAGWQGWSGAVDGMQRASTDSYADLLANGSVDSTLERIIENYGRAEADYLASGRVRNEGVAPDGVIAYEVADPIRSTLYIVRNAEAKDISRNSVTPKGVETFTNLGKSSLLFDSQIKSATGNVGTFDPSNDDIRFRVAPSTPSTGKARQMYDEAVRSHTKKNNVKKSENLWHHLREAYQDSMLSVQKLMDAVLAETGNTLRSSDDVYKAENQLSSKNKAEIEKWERDFMKPLQLEILDLVKKGASYEDIVEYLLAKHGLERNLEFSRREAEEDGKVWDGFVKRDFSGLTELTGEAEHFTEAAQQIVEEFEGKYNTANLWSKINAATKESLKKSYDSGLMSKETYDKVANMFQYYIPLRGWDNNVAADQYEYMANKGMKILPALKTAKGRTSRADDPIATLGSVGESSIIQGNRNLMKQKFLNFAQNNPTSLLTVDEQWYEQNADGTWKPSNPEIPTDATADEVDAIIKAHEAKMEALGDKATKKRQGLNINLHTTKWEEEEHAVNVKRNGKEYKIYVNGNPIAAQAINGFTNPNANKKDSWEWIEQRATAVKNFMARAFTSMNPAFVLSNLARDIIWAGTSVAIKENADYTRQYSKNISNAMLTAQLPKLVSKWKKGTLDMSDPIEKYFHEFITNGGETGFTQLNTVDDYKRNMERFIKEAQGGVTTKAKKGWRWIWDNVEFLNRSAEDTTRFMVYLTSRQMGRPISESIANAKDITVNFNKKGRGTMGANVLGFAYIFFNATIQSLANFGKLIANHPKKTVAALTTFGASGMITPMVALAVQAMLSGDDDEPTYWDLPEWVRRNNIVIYVGGSGYVTIPLPHELRPFYGMGELAFSTLMGKEEPEAALQKAVEGFASLMPFDFTGNAGNAIVNFTPTIAQPLVQLAVNKDYFGTPIYRKTAFNEQDPEWTKAYKSTNQLLVDATEFLNELTGGDEVKNGLIDLNPAVIEHLYEGYLGGMGKTINRAAKTFSMLWDEDARTWRNVPVASSFYQVSDERTSGSQVNREYFDAVDEADAIEHLYSGYRKRAKMGVEEYAEKLNELIESDAFKRYQKVNSYKKAIAKLNTVLKEADPTDREDIETRIMELKVDMLEELDAMDIK